MATKKELTLEDNFKILEECVSKLENGNLPLEEAFKMYKEGIEVVNRCNNLLDKVEKQIVVLNGEEVREND